MKIETNQHIDCFQLKYIGIYSAILLILSFGINITSLSYSWKNKHFKKPINILMMCLSLINLYGTIFGIPFIMINAFSCKFLFQNIGCKLEAFTMYFVGCLNIYLQMTVSLERYNVLIKPNRIQMLSLGTCLKLIVFNILVSLFFATMPLVGWSSYDLEGLKISCSIAWSSKDFKGISYNLTALIFVYLIPVIVMSYTTLKNIYLLKSWKSKIKLTENNTSLKIFAEKERIITIITFMSMLSMFISWTPYSLASLYSMLVEPESVEPLWATIPALFAKASLIWPSLYNIILNKKIN